MNKTRLSLNIDHIATLRNARGGTEPCPVRGAQLAKECGADGITAHLREDRRHVKDRDIVRLKSEVSLPLNLEMAATEEMLGIALAIRPHAVCLVPEKRAELTTEGGLDVIHHAPRLLSYVGHLRDAGIHVSLFIDPEERQLQAAAQLRANGVELHTGTYALAAARKEQDPEAYKRQLAFLFFAARESAALGLDVHAGHGLDFANVGPIAAIPEVSEISIGHFMIGESVFLGLPEVIRRMRAAMEMHAA